MLLTGHIENGAVVLDAPAALPDGTPVQVEVPGPTIPEYWPGPPPGETAEEWIARFRAFCESHPVRDIVIDDDRGSIYDRNTP